MDNKIWFAPVVKNEREFYIFLIISAIVILGINQIVNAQSADEITHVMTQTTGEQKTFNTTNTNTTIKNNNSSNAALGSLFSTGEDTLTNYNRTNETYTEISYVGNRTLMPTQGVTTAPINATETGKLKLKSQPNGITLVEGTSILKTKVGVGDNISRTEKQENATAMIVDLNGVRPSDPRISTGVAFFSTNSTGKLAFLHKMIAIYQVKASPMGTGLIKGLTQSDIM